MNTRKYLWVLGFMLFFCLNVLSQRVIEGVVVNKETGAPVANVNMTTQDKRIGTSSDSQGRFSLRFPRDYTGKWLYLSAVGYFKDSVRIEETRELSVVLAPQVYTLKEVYVMPDSSLLTLLRKAYHRIPENYPSVPTMSEGFYRESAKNNDEEQADFIEAIVSIYKDAYDHPTNSPGQIEILKSRKRKIRDTGILYYGGAFVPIERDFVLSRASFISPRHFKNYRYKFEGIKALGEDEFYEISFEKTSRDTAKQIGTILIEKESLAYVSFETSKEYTASHPQVKSRKYKEYAGYEKDGEKWYFKYYTSTREDLKRNERIIYGSLDYVTTAIRTEAVKPIPYERRLGYMEPIVLKADEYDESGWTDYDALKQEQTEGMVFQFSPEESAEIFKQKSMSGKVISERDKQGMRKLSILTKIYTFLTRFTFEYGIAYQSVSYAGGTSDLMFSPDATSSFDIKTNVHPNEPKILFLERTGFRLNNNMELFYQQLDDFLDVGAQSKSIGLEYRKNIKGRGLPLFLSGAMLFSSNEYFKNLGTFDNPQSFRIKGKKFNSDQLLFDYGIQEYVIAPQIALSSQIRKHLTFKLYGMYQFELGSHDKFRIREKSGLFRQSVTLDADDHRLVNRGDDLWRSITAERFQVGASLVWAF